MAVRPGPTARARRAKAAKRLRAARNVYQQVDERDGFKCRYCGRYDPYNHRHHIRYRSLGGEDTTANIVTLCPQHHQQVHAKTLQIFGMNADCDLIFVELHPEVLA